MREIYMNNGESIMVDDADYNWLSQYTWRPDKDGYPRTNLPRDSNGKRPTVFMHRMIMMAQRGQIIDHIDGNRRNNQRSNLRFVSRRQNAQNRKKPINNTSGYKGVNARGKGRYEAKLCNEGEYIFCGIYSNALAAAHAYNHYARLYFGDHAQINEVEPMDDWQSHRIEIDSTSKWRGVSRNTQCNKWEVSISHDGKRYYLGLYESEIEAALAYNQMAIELKGSNAKLNKIEEEVV